jgi:CRP-like cAMP-binding protein
MDMGADDYLTKPFDSTDLLSAIESRLRKSEITKTEYAKSKEGFNEFLDGAKEFEDLKKLSEENEVRTLKKKDSIYFEGNYPKGIFFINKGKIKTFRSNDQGKEFITALYKEGDFFGYLALLEESKYSDSASALEDAEVCMIPKEQFYTLIYKNAEISRKFIKMISDNLEEKEEQLLQLAYNSVRKRVAEALVTLCKRYQKEGDKNFSMNMPREDLANLAGTATETTIRTLSDFKDEGLIEIKGSTIVVREYEKLAKMKN